MESWKSVFGVLDLLIKVTLAGLAFVLFGVEKERLGIEAQQLDIQQKQQTSTLVVAERIISLLFEEKNKCIAEDQAFLIDFLIDNNNAYNRIQINKDDFSRASAARRNCTGGSVARDAATSASLNQGSVPVVNSEVITRIHKELQGKGVTVARAPDGQEEPSGYVAVGALSASGTSFRNFVVPSDNVKPDGSIAADTIISARWSVYLRANTDNTEEFQCHPRTRERRCLPKGTQVLPGRARPDLGGGQAGRLPWGERLTGHVGGSLRDIPTLLWPQIGPPVRNGQSTPDGTARSIQVLTAFAGSSAWRNWLRDTHNRVAGGV